MSLRHPAIKRTKEQTKERTKKRTNERTNEKTKDGTNERTNKQKKEKRVWVNVINATLENGGNKSPLGQETHESYP